MNVVLFNPLKLSDEQFETIEALVALNYTPAQMAVYMEVDYVEFKKAIDAPNSKIQFHLTRGKLQSKFLIQQKQLLSAQGGNVTAKQEYDKSVRNNEVEQIKRKILFYED